MQRGQDYWGASISSNCEGQDGENIMAQNRKNFWGAQVIPLRWNDFFTKSDAIVVGTGTENG